MNDKKITVFWLFISIIWSDLFIYYSFYTTTFLNKKVIFAADLIFFLIYLIFTYRKKKASLLSLACIIMPVLYCGIYLIINELDHLKSSILFAPFFAIVAIKSLVGGYMVLIAQKEEIIEDTPSLKRYTWANFYIPLLLIISLNIFYILTDMMVPGYDPARHARNAITVSDIFFSRDGGILQAWMFYDWYPSLSYIVTIPFQFIFGHNYDSLVLSLILFWMPLTYLFTYRIFRDVFNIRNGTETILNFAFHSNIMLLSFMKQFLIDYPILTFLTAQFYFLYRSENFKKLNFILLAGVMIGLGFMIKETFLFYGAVLSGLYLVFVLFEILRQKKFDNLIEIYTKIMAYSSIAGAIILLWFLGWCFMFYFEFKGIEQRFGMAEGDPEPFSVSSFLWYFKFFGYYFTWPGLFIILTGYISIFFKFKNKQVLFIMLAGLILVWLFFTLRWNKDARYLSGIFIFFMPGYAGIAYLNKYFARILLGGITAISLCANFGQVFPALNNNLFNSASVYAKSHVGASYINKPLSLAVSTLILSNYDVLNYEIESQNEDGENCEFNRSFYIESLGVKNIKYSRPLKGVWTKKEIFARENVKSYAYIKGAESMGEEYVLFRDAIYPCYYMYKFSKIDKGLLITKMGHYGRISGDVKFKITYNHNNKRKRKLVDFDYNQEIIIPIEDTTNISIQSTIQHNHGRWPLIYREIFSGEIKGEYITADMIPLRSNVVGKDFQF